jgi:hypothetical protein
LHSEETTADEPGSPAGSALARLVSEDSLASSATVSSSTRAGEVSPESGPAEERLDASPHRRRRRYEAGTEIGLLESRVADLKASTDTLNADLAKLMSDLQTKRPMPIWLW